MDARARRLWESAEPASDGAAGHVDWAATALGAYDLWPDAMRHAVALVLNLRIPAAFVTSDGLIAIPNAARAGASVAPRAYQTLHPGVEQEAEARASAVLRGESDDPCCAPVRDEGGVIIGFVEIGVPQPTVAPPHAFLLRLNDALRALDDPAAIQRTASRLLGEEIGVDRVFYCEIVGEPGSRDALVRGQYTRAGEPLPDTLDYDAFDPAIWASDTLVRGEAVVIRDAEHDAGPTDNTRAAWRQIGVGALVVAGLVKQGREAVNFGVFQNVPRDWTAGEIELVREVGERTWSAAERARAEEALRQREAWLQVLMQGIAQLVWRAAQDGAWTWASPQWVTYTGLAESASRGDGWLDAIHPDDREAARAAWRTAPKRGRLRFDARIRRADGAYRWFTTQARPVRDADGTIIEWLGTSTDIDDQRRLQETQRFLLNELQHRVRNMLAVVRSIFGRTVEAGGTLEDVADHFRGRLDSLARTQSVATGNAEVSVDLENLVREELLSVGVSDGPSLSVEGPEVVLPARIAETFGLAIHELTTNALKFGAIRVSRGHISIRWSVDADCRNVRWLRFTWTEEGVPAVPLVPPRAGFGTELISEALPYRLGAETQMQFLGGGLRCRIDVPMPDDPSPGTG